MNESLFMIFRVMIVLSVALLVVGIFKPEWIRFGQKQPGRPTIIAVALSLLVIGLSGVGAIQPAGKDNAETVHPGNGLGEALYVVNNDTLHCDPGAKPGHAGASNDEQTAAGIRYMVKRRSITMQALPIRYSWSTRRREQIDMSQKTLCLSHKKPRRQVSLWPMPIIAR